MILMTHLVLLPGYNLRSTEINAAAGIEQLKKLPYLIKQRRKCIPISKSFENSKIYFTKRGREAVFGLHLF